MLNPQLSPRLCPIGLDTKPLAHARPYRLGRFDHAEIDKGKPGASRGRKATGLAASAAS